MDDALGTQERPSRRSRFSEDICIEQIGRKLDSNKIVRLLELACGDCGLAIAMEKAGLDLKRIFYHGIDNDQRLVQKMNEDAEQSRRRRRFGSFKIELGDIRQASRYVEHRVDFVVANHVFHEIPARDIPKLIAEMNHALASRGEMILADMERMPGGISEHWAILWKREELEWLLHAAGFSPRTYRLEKSVPVYRAVAARCNTGLDLRELQRVLTIQLNTKLRDAVASAEEFRLSLEMSTALDEANAFSIRALLLELNALRRRSGWSDEMLAAGAD